MSFNVVKDPHAVLDYTLDYTLYLDGDTIATSVWSADAGITVDSENETTTKATVWLSGGTAGNTYRVTNTITTAGFRTDDRTLIVVVAEQ